MINCENTTRPVMILHYIDNPDKESPQRRILADRYEGVFWGFSHESDSGESYPVAIVELPDGTVNTPLASMIRFLKNEAGEPI